ncbi:5'-methylthioadenosine/S-adenosylhomocysteine nucleosidase [Streptomyces sp. NPDC051976]|uniref:5'-methylthioadenosine/S-adenosylhomocysteine nucleosidase n=1 Tax=Streptomyces sp. NPDC051976 TaxID=3154947 RepID=UPI0034205CFA
MNIRPPDGVLTNTAAGYGSSAWIGVRVYPAPVHAGPRSAAGAGPQEWQRSRTAREEQGWLAGQWAAPALRRFEVRYANDPRTGLVTCTLLGAVRAADEERATAAALALRDSLLRVPGHLRAEPVVDPGELGHRLAPFDIASGQSAEIRKRLSHARLPVTEMPHRPLGVEVHPLRAADVSWDPVWTALAGLPYPAMVGVCLGPCELGADVREWFRFLAREYGRVADAAHRRGVPNPYGVQSGTDPFAARAAQSFGAAAERYAHQPFRWRMTVAAAGPLPAPLLGYLADAVGGVVVPVHPAEARDSAYAVRTLNHVWLEASYGGGLPEGAVQPPERALSEVVDVTEAAAAFRLPFPSQATADVLDHGGRRASRTSALAVVLTALDLEYQAVRDRLDDREVLRHESGLIVETGTLPGSRWRVALARIGPGALGAAAVTQLVSGWLRPQVLFFVGVAGALRPDLEIGDVVVATKIYAYTGGRSTDDGLLSRPEAWQAPFWLQQEAGHHLRDGGWAVAAAGAAAVPRVPRVHFKPIATGDVVVDSTRSAHAVLLRERFEDAVAVEMEASGVAQAAHMVGDLPVLVIRGISDHADGDKRAADAAGGQPYAAAHAAAAALAVIAGLDPHAPQVRAP